MQVDLFENPNPITTEDINIASKKFCQELIDEGHKKKMIDILIKNAQSLHNQADKINTDVSGNWTVRRQRFADSAYKKKESLIKYATILNKLADCWKNNYSYITEWNLEKIKSKSDIEWAFYTGFPNEPDENHPEGGWYRKDYPTLLKKALSYGINSKEGAKRISTGLINLKTDKPIEDPKAKQLREALVKIRGANIPGFFPTPDELIDQMLEYANIKINNYVLEPSAGIGSICDRIKLHYPTANIFCVESQWSLRKILELKGYTLSCDDILLYETSIRFDRIIMNPPFENGQDIDHVLYCYNNLLKEGGRLVAIMSSSAVQGGSRKKYQEFKQFIEDMGADIIHNGQAFKGAFNSTATSTITLILDKL